MSETGGYDVGHREYLRGFRRNANPCWLRAVQVLRGRRPMDLSGRFDMVDFGCGSGFQLLATAAAHPRARFVGVDVSADHVLAGRALAEAAGLENVRFVEATFDEVAARPELVGEVDVAVAHGVWTWVSAEVQGALTLALRRTLRTGGLLYLGYNAMPAWAAGAPIRRLVHLLAEGRIGAAKEAAVGEALDTLKALRASKAGIAAADSALGELVDRLHGRPMGYLAHELLPSAGGGAWHVDVGRALEAAHLSYLGAAGLLENFDQLIFPDELVDRIAAAEAAGWGETLRDFALSRSFRMDVFARGSVRLRGAEAGAAVEALPVALTTGDWTEGALARTPWGEVGIEPELGAAAVRALAEGGPCTLGEAADRMAAAGVDRRRAGQTLTVLLAAEKLMPLATVAPEPEAEDACARFNAAVLAAGITWPCLASARAGGGVEASDSARAAVEGDPAPEGRAPERVAFELATFAAVMPGGALPRAPGAAS